MTLAFDPTYTASQITLSNSSKTATRNVTGSANTYAVAMASIGHADDVWYYWELHIDSITGGFFVGGVNDTLSATDIVGLNGTHSLAYFNGTPSYLHGGAEDTVGSTVPTVANGDVLCFRLNPFQHALQIRKNGGSWVAAPTSYLGSGATYYPAIAIRDNALSGFTINGGDTAFTYTMPTGDVAWDAGTPAGGSGAYTEATDTGAGSGSGGSTGSGAYTEATDTGAGTGSGGSSGSGSYTEATDTGSGAGTSAAPGTGAYTEATDTGAGSGSGGSTGSGAYTEAADTGAGSGAGGSTGSGSYTEGTDTGGNAPPAPAAPTGGGAPYTLQDWADEALRKRRRRKKKADELLEQIAEGRKAAEAHKAAVLAELAAPPPPVDLEVNDQAEVAPDGPVVLQAPDPVLPPAPAPATSIEISIKPELDELMVEIRADMQRAVHDIIGHFRLTTANLSTEVRTLQRENAELRRHMAILSDDLEAYQAFAHAQAGGKVH